MKTNIRSGGGQNHNHTTLLDRHYKFAHIFLHNSVGFNLQLINLICDSNNGFDVEEQLFITTFKPLYDMVLNKCNAVYCDNPGHNGMDVVNMYGDCADWLIVHSIPGRAVERVFELDKRLLGKIIWRTWGHDVSAPDRFNLLHSDNLFKDIVIKIYSIVFYVWRRRQYYAGKRRLQKLYAVGIGNAIDAINVKESFGITKTYSMPYIDGKEYMILKTLSNAGYNDGYYHVMVGHSGAGIDRHCEVLDVLKSYQDRKIMIHLILSYGKPQYIDRVKRYAADMWNGRIEIVEDYLEYNRYAEYVNKMDAVILDGLPSYALGNLSMLLYMRKKLFLNRNGVLQKGLAFEKILFHYTDEILNMSFEDFCAKEEYDVPKDSTLVMQPYDKYVSDWKQIFEELENVKEK